MPELGSPPELGGPALESWIATHVHGTKPPFRFRLIAGGRSNLTYEVIDRCERAVVLRRPPLGRVLDSAHDMAREFRILTALRRTRVPVPAVLAFCDDRAVLDVPLYVMERVDGLILRTAEDARRELDELARARAGDGVIATLANLHLLEPDRVGLGTLGRREGYVQRQLRRWQRQWDVAKTRDIGAVEEAHRLLSRHARPEHRAAIVHGDYRIDNIVLGADGSVRAVLDWELCTLGDPLADLGMLLMYWRLPGEASDHLLAEMPTAAGGFGERARLLEHYAGLTGADVSRIDFYVALAHWKLACIAEGVHRRYRDGAMGGVAAPPELASAVERLAESALDIARTL